MGSSFCKHDFQWDADLSAICLVELTVSKIEMVHPVVSMNLLMKSHSRLPIELRSGYKYQPGGESCEHDLESAH